MPEASRGVIFDLDGTLLNTINDLAASMNRALQAAGYPTHTVEDYHYFVGNGATELVKRSLPQDACSKQNIQHIKTLFSEDYATHCHDNTSPYAGINTLLDLLQKRHVPLAVLSNKPHRYMDDIRQEYFSTIRFVSFLGQREEYPHKPDPKAVLEIAQEMNLPPQRILYVGDSCVDMQTASNAGMRSCGVLWGYRSESELRENGAEFIVDRAEGVLLALENL